MLLVLFTTLVVLVFSFCYVYICYVWNFLICTKRWSVRSVSWRGQKGTAEKACLDEQHVKAKHLPKNPLFSSKSLKSKLRALVPPINGPESEQNLAWLRCLFLQNLKLSLRHSAAVCLPAAAALSWICITQHFNRTLWIKGLFQPNQRWWLFGTVNQEQLTINQDSFSHLSMKLRSSRTCAQAPYFRMETLACTYRKYLIPFPLFPFWD